MSIRPTNLARGLKAEPVRACFISGVYCALSAAHLSNIYSPELFDKTAQWVLRCQTYEGGFGGVPGMEAHGGYSFCGLAALMLMNKAQLCNTENLLKWAANRQMRLEGGFQVLCALFLGLFGLLSQVFIKCIDRPMKKCLETAELAKKC